ncbi:MAG: hypothetical protein CBB71_14555 [Rhodopirellula sp. TMED11]|nr:MAG: hypothetical protein CBB71_14555 [Rhodopirellula sp. TMED11]
MLAAAIDVLQSLRPVRRVRSKRSFSDQPLHLLCFFADLSLSQVAPGRQGVKAIDRWRWPAERVQRSAGRIGSGIRWLSH